MEKKVITYKNRMEIRILLIAYAVIFLPLGLFVIINDILHQNEHLLQNLLYFSVVLAIALIPLLVIARYRIQFDYQNRTITYVPYFKPKKTFSFDDVTVKYVEQELAFPAYRFVFYVQDKKLFKISDIDFEAQTKQSSDKLKELFSGTEKAMYEWEQKYKKMGVVPHVTQYASETSDRVIYIGKCDIKLHIAYVQGEDLFVIQVHKLVFEDPPEHFREPLKKLLEEHVVTPANLDAACNLLIAQYKKE